MVGDKLKLGKILGMRYYDMARLLAAQGFVSSVGWDAKRCTMYPCCSGKFAELAVSDQACLGKTCRYTSTVLQRNVLCT